MTRAEVLRRLPVLLALLAAPAAVRGAPAAPLPVITLALDGPVSVADVPYLSAAASGAFNAAGIDVSISHPEGQGAALASAAAGVTDACVADAVSLLAARAGGSKITIVATIGDLHPACLVSRPETPIAATAGLAGRRAAADPLNGDRLLFPLFLTGAGLRPEDVSIVLLDPAAGAAALVAGTVDAALDRVENAGPGLAVLPWASHGFDVYGPCLGVRDDVLRSRPGTVRRFLKAVLRAWETCLRDPASAARSAAASGLVTRDAAESWLAAVRYRFDTDTYRRKGLGWIDRSRMAATLEAVRGMLGQPVTFAASTAFTTAYLPVPAVLRKADAAGSPATQTIPLKR